MTSTNSVDGCVEGECREAWRSGQNCLRGLCVDAALHTQSVGLPGSVRPRVETANSGLDIWTRVAQIRQELDAIERVERARVIGQLQHGPDRAVEEALQRPQVIAGGEWDEVEVVERIRRRRRRIVANAPKDNRLKRWLIWGVLPSLTAAAIAAAVEASGLTDFFSFL